VSEWVSDCVCEKERGGGSERKRGGVGRVLTAPLSRFASIVSHPTGVSAIAIATGFVHTCAIVAGGGVKCWGGNEYGQLGIGDITDKWSPADVPGAARANTLMVSLQCTRKQCQAAIPSASPICTA
jgi:alpha-tubulin suppressor-like RCC1 family protein